MRGPRRHGGSRILERLGYTVIGAATGTEAFAAAGAQRGAITLLLTDVVMPDMNGVDVFTQLSVERPGLKVLFMSGHTEGVIAAHNVPSAGIALLAKPFLVPELAAMVRCVPDGRLPTDPPPQP